MALNDLHGRLSVCLSVCFLVSTTYLRSSPSWDRPTARRTNQSTNRSIDRSIDGVVSQGGLHDPARVFGVQGHPAGAHDPGDLAEEAREGPHAEGVHARAHRRGATSSALV